MTATEKRKARTANLRLFFTGVGGQGTLLASRVLGEAALAAGLDPLVSETHGMAQRGGIVVSTVVLGDLKSPIISLGEADIVLGFEALETFRALDRCHAGTLVIANRATIVPYPVAIGQAQYPPVDQMFELMAAQVGSLLAFDAGTCCPGSGQPAGGEHGPAGGTDGHGAPAGFGGGSVGSDPLPHQPQVPGVQPQGLRPGRGRGPGRRQLAAALSGAAIIAL